MYCSVCERECDGEVEQADVRSNVRKFAAERFVVWRCSHCLSLHARDSVALEHYYADYPFHKLRDVKADALLRAMYRNLLSRLRAVGVGPRHSVLDYGCGSGLFLSFLRERGYADVRGYDEYSEQHADAGALTRTYDCVMSQDVLEHVPEPLALVRTMHELCKPGGLIVIGTPNAEAIDLSAPEARIHTLHQPYHRHILSKRALLELGRDLGWKLVRYYPTMYANTLTPGANTAFINHYFAINDNNCDLAVEAPRLRNWRLWTPVTLAHLLLGYFWPVESDVMAVFRRAA